MKRLLIGVVVIGAMLLAGCSSNKMVTGADRVSASASDSAHFKTKTNIKLDDFIESYNSIAENADIESLERNGNETISADGLLVIMNENGTVKGVSQINDATPLTVTATVLAIKDQANKEDAEKIDVLLDGFVNALDDGEPYKEEISIESMTISLTATDADFILFHALGDEQY